MQVKMHDVSMIVVLSMLLILTGSTWGDNSVDSIIRDVGQHDKHYSSDLHRTLQGRNGSFRLTDLKFGDWKVTSVINIRKGYIGPVVDDERVTLKGVFESINDSQIFIHGVEDKTGRQCNISIGGQQLIRNYVRYYRRLKEKMITDHGLATLGFEYDGVNVTVASLQALAPKEVDHLKYLPYQINHLQELYGFTVPGFEMNLLFTKFEITVHGNCLPNDIQLHMTPRGNIYSLNSSTQLPGLAYRQHNCSKIVTQYGSNRPCLDIRKDIDNHIAQLFLLVMHLQISLFRTFSSSGYGIDHELCTVTMLARKKIRDVNKNDYILSECCTIEKQHALPFELRVSELWHCRDPYHFTKILAILARALSIVLVTLFPLTINWAPPNVAKSKPSDKNASRNQPTRFVPESGSSTEGETNFSKPAKDTTEQVHDGHGWMFLDKDSGYHFGFRIIVWYLLLFHKVNRGLVILRRLLLLYIIAFLHLLASLQMYLYYTPLYESSWKFHWTTYFMAEVVGNIDHLRYSEWGFNTLMFVTLFVIPMSIAGTQFIFLSPILCQKKSIAEILYWEENKTALCRYVGTKNQQHYQDMQHFTFEVKLWSNLVCRLSYLSQVKFWKYLLRQGIYKVSNGPRNMFTTFARILVNVIFLPVTSLCYTIPVFTIFRVIFLRRRGRIMSKQWCKDVFIHLILTFGIAYFVLLLLACLTIYMYMALMIIIDVIRSLSSTLTPIIFLISVILNIKQTFRRLEDRYRDMKLIVFNLLDGMSNSSSELERQLSQSVLNKFHGRSVAIPKALFAKICQVHLPYIKMVSKGLLLLVGNLTFLGLLYIIIIDYHVLDQFSETAESIISVVFVSIPSLFSKHNSDVEKELAEKQLSLKVKLTLTNILESKKMCGNVQKQTEI